MTFRVLTIGTYHGIDEHLHSPPDVLSNAVTTIRLHTQGKILQIRVSPRNASYFVG